MKISSRSLGRASVLAGCLSTGLAWAYPPFDHNFDYFNQYWWGMPGAWQLPVWGPGTWNAMPMQTGFHINQGADLDRYYVNIQLAGSAPEQVLVSLDEGRWLTIRIQDRSSTHQEFTSPQGNGWTRTYSFGGGQQMMRITLPPDADFTAMARDNQPGLVRLVIPRRR